MRSVMLALVSSSTKRSTGTFVDSKNRTSCFTPSSKTAKSPGWRPVTYFAPPSMTVTLSDTRLAPLRNVGSWMSEVAGDCASTGAAARAKAETRTSRVTSCNLRGPGLQGTFPPAVGRGPRGFEYGGVERRIIAEPRADRLWNGLCTFDPVARRRCAWVASPDSRQRSKTRLVALSEFIPPVGVALAAEVFQRVSRGNAAEAAARFEIRADRQPLEQTTPKRIAHTGWIHESVGRDCRHRPLPLPILDRTPLLPPSDDERAG